jgi:putative transposase
MIGFKFTLHMVFKWQNDEYKIERIQKNGEILLESIEEQNLVLTKREVLLADYKAGNISIIEDSLNAQKIPLFSRPLDELPQKDLDKAKRKLFYLEKVFAQGRPIFTVQYLRPLIQKIAAEVNDVKPPSVTSVYRWYDRYRVTGDIRSLIPRTDLRGSTKLRQSEKTLALAVEAVEEAFRDCPQASVGKIYTLLDGKIRAENQNNPLNKSLKVPSRRTLYRMLERVEIYEMVRLKEGRAEAERRFRLSKYKVKTSRILERAEVDHTPLDLFIIDERTWLPLGRPTLTVIIDHFSRMLLGYFLTFEAPSMAAVIGALRHAILPKTLADPAVPNLPIYNTWPCYGLLESLVADNGPEFLSHTLENLAFDLDIRLQFCPKRQPLFKGVVERYLKTINYNFVSQLPGASYARFYQRGDYDPQKAALLTLAEFKHVFEKWVVDIYAQSEHKGINYALPAVRWQESMALNDPRLPNDLRTLQRRIGLVKEVTLRKDGVIIDYIRYNSDSLSPIFRAYGSGIKLRAVYDPEDLGEIQVWGPNDTEPIAVPALDQAYAKGLTIRQNKLIRQNLRETGGSIENRETLERCRYELAQAIANLMHGRKLKDRQRSAALRGITSSQPSGTNAPSSLSQGVMESESKPKARQSKVQPAVDTQDQAMELVPILPTFTLKR